MVKLLGEKIRYIPSCKCHETFYENKLNELSKENQRERILNRGKKYRNFSVIDNKFLNSTFENAEVTENISVCKNLLRLLPKRKSMWGLFFTEIPEQEKVLLLLV